jgi:hypothetical protein
MNCAPGIRQGYCRARSRERFDLGRTVVRAPVGGTVSNMSLQPGVYLTAGKPALALLGSQSLRVEGYFEETKLPAIRVGDPASVYLMGVRDEITGHVESIAGGVEDRERGGTDGQLANVNPSFTWVRLAQRIPVRIAVDKVPPGVRLIPGQTATVIIHPAMTGAKCIAACHGEARNSSCCQYCFLQAARRSDRTTASLNRPPSTRPRRRVRSSPAMLPPLRRRSPITGGNCSTIPCSMASLPARSKPTRICGWPTPISSAALRCSVCAGLIATGGSLSAESQLCPALCRGGALARAAAAAADLQRGAGLQL